MRLLLDTHALLWWLAGGEALSTEALDAIAANGFLELPLTVEHAQEVGALPPHHPDPFDRLLVVQAQLEDLTIVTRDPAFEAYGISLSAA